MLTVRMRTTGVKLMHDERQRFSVNSISLEATMMLDDSDAGVRINYASNSTVKTVTPSARTLGAAATPG